MIPEPPEGERHDPDDRAVRERLEAIARERRGRVRWRLSHHTAEQALMAISDVAPRTPYRRSSKSRRRKRTKRLL
ncbi:MAG: hypothetical protein KGL38_13830 [Gemmatimonadota bacterium]|nr:hypothetical protein [Gemmatimonadota bacterium]MDE3173680.1 hypothetical protein [Gemmatimonadota bacterium]MDE3215574.1 hypothetical protein [Gemmatimonadota bacterium]